MNNYPFILFIWYGLQEYPHLECIVPDELNILEGILNHSISRYCALGPR